jgi:N-acetyl-gamma-glutamyl-phosphate reductase
VTTSIGIVGARGYVGSELIRLLAGHPQFELAFVSSRERAGQRLADHEAGYTGELRYVSLNPAEVASQPANALVLALPNGMAKEYVAAFDEANSDPIIVDLSADYRFDDGWHYGLPELTRSQADQRRRIANPGCYATAMQLAIEPVRELLDGPVQCFGVSGYSGAGTTPSDNNNPDNLRDNLIPYALIGHLHEREVAHRLDKAVEFMPHVAPHFRGLTITANMHLSRPLSLAAVEQRYRDRYADEPLVRVLGFMPWVSRIAGKHLAEVGGFSLSADGRRLVVVATLDNLLKGAATQALQNLNRAFGFDEMTGIPVDGDLP